MKLKRFLLRCYAVKEGEQWQAFCIDFYLVAQSDSYEEARNKLFSMIREYLHDMNVGEDKESTDRLLKRKAPWIQFMTYYYYKFMYRLGILRDDLRCLFKTPMPLLPQHFV